MYEPSLNNGSFGSFIYPHTEESLNRILIPNIRFDFDEIIKTLQVVSYLFVRNGKLDYEPSENDEKSDTGNDNINNNNNNNNNKWPPYGLWSEESLRQAIRLMFQLSSYVQSLSILDDYELSINDLYSQLKQLYNTNDNNNNNIVINYDICTIIHSYYTLYPFKFLIGWKRVPFVNDTRDQKYVFNIKYKKWQFQTKNKIPKQIKKHKNCKNDHLSLNLDMKDDNGSNNNNKNIRKRKKYDLFYFINVDETGNSNLWINFQVCHNPKLCEKTMGYSSRVRDVNGKSDKCCLGTCPGRIIRTSFDSYKEHALLIAKIVQYHQLDGKLCHSIYISKNVGVGTKNRQKVIDWFNKIYDSNTKVHHGDQRYISPFGMSAPWFARS